MSENKEEARRLGAFLKEKGVKLQYSELLEATAAMKGVRNWQTLEAKREKTPAIPPRLAQAIEDLENSADNEGCSNSLTVVGSRELKRVLFILKKEQGGKKTNQLENPAQENIEKLILAANDAFSQFEHNGEEDDNDKTVLDNLQEALEKIDFKKSIPTLSVKPN